MFTALAMFNPKLLCSFSIIVFNMIKFLVVLFIMKLTAQIDIFKKAQDISVSIICDGHFDVILMTIAHKFIRRQTLYVKHLDKIDVKHLEKIRLETA